MMREQHTRKIALDRALCQLGGVAATIERQRGLIEQMRSYGCSTQYAEMLLRSFERIQSEQARMLADVQARTGGQRRKANAP